MAININVEGKKYVLALPNGMALRTQNPDCNKKNCICAIMDKNLVCAKLTLKPEKDGSFSFFELVPCSQSKNKIVMEIE